MYDIAIIGAGPAGATLARLVGDKHKVLLVDKRCVDDPAQAGSGGKCCGGLLAPDAQHMLAKMGLGLPKDVLVGPQLFVVRAIDVAKGIERHYQRFYFNMDRGKFDQWLYSLVPESVDRILGCKFYSCERSAEGGFKLQLGADGAGRVEHARIVIGADGGASRVRKMLHDKHPWPRKYIAIQEWVKADHQQPHFSSIFDPEITDYYCWTIPKDGHLIIGAALKPKDNAHAKFELLKDKLRKYGFRFGETVFREGAYILRPQRMGQMCTGANGIGLIGEAGGWISPSSAEGFSYAFKSAVVLADVLNESLNGFEKRYHRHTRGLRRTLLTKTLKAQVIYRPWVRSIVMKTGLRSMKVHSTATA